MGVVVSILFGGFGLVVWWWFGLFFWWLECFLVFIMVFHGLYRFGGVFETMGLRGVALLWSSSCSSGVSAATSGPCKGECEDWPSNLSSAKHRSGVHRAL